MATTTSNNELRVQKAVDEAQDPNSKVTGADVQKRILSESKKAGVTAFTFDANASTSEKVAQAKAVSPSRIQGPPTRPRDRD